MLHCIKIHRAKFTTHCLLKEIILFKQPNGTFNLNIVLVSIDILIELLWFDIVCIWYNIWKKGMRTDTDSKRTIQGWYNYKHLWNSMPYDFNVSSMTPVAYTFIYYLDIWFAVCYLMVVPLTTLMITSLRILTLGPCSLHREQFWFSIL